MYVTFFLQLVKQIYRAISRFGVLCWHTRPVNQHSTDRYISSSHGCSHGILFFPLFIIWKLSFFKKTKKTGRTHVVSFPVLCHLIFSHFSIRCDCVAVGYRLSRNSSTNRRSYYISPTIYRGLGVIISTPSRHIHCYRDYVLRLKIIRKTKNKNEIIQRKICVCI